MSEVTATIVEHHLLLREALCRVLEADGVRVLGAHGDRKAFVEAISAVRPSVALVGALLPQTACEVVREVAHVSPGLPMVVLAAATHAARMQECLRFGASAYLDRFHVGCEAVTRTMTAVASGASVTPSLPVRDRAATSRVDQLSDRELEVLGHVAAGMGNKEIALHLGISEHTVKVHVSHLYKKLGQHSRTEMALFARDAGVAIPPWR